MTETNHRSQVTAICSPAGGTGRTTLTIGMSVELAKLGRRVLVLDLDPGRYATRVLAGPITGDDGGNALARAIDGDRHAALITSQGPSLLTCGQKLDEVLHAALGDPMGALIDALRQDYDHVFIDTTTSRAAPWARALHRCDLVVLTTPADTSMLDRLLSMRARIARTHGSPGPRVAGCVLMKADEGEPHTRAFIDALDACEHLDLLRPIIPMSDRVARIRPDENLFGVLPHELRRRFRGLACQLDGFFEHEGVA